MFTRAFAQAAALAAVLACGTLHAQESIPYFGQHFPNGDAAVNYLYGPSGMWRDQSGLQYQWNYYERCANGRHPFNLEGIIAEGSVTNVTAPDSDCLILGDMNNDGETADDAPAGFAFVEHTGRGIGGNRSGSPFYQFWFDDNWVARYMAQAYQRPLPNGLHDNGALIRWRLLGGDNSGWRPASQNDRINPVALNGLHAINDGNVRVALAYWRRIRELAGATYDAASRRFVYPGALETYELGLWGILTERILANSSSFAERSELLQHAVAIRADLLSRQEKDATGRLLGWRTAPSDPRTLINTETSAITVLALGAQATWVLEPGQAPLRATSSANLLLSPENVLSAVVGQSAAGEILVGPDWNVSAGTYDIDFTLRTAAATGSADVASLSVSDGAGVLASAAVLGSEMAGSDQWIRRRLTVVVNNPGNQLRVVVSWPGAVNLDVGPVRIIRRGGGGTATSTVSTPLPVKLPAPITRDVRSASASPATREVAAPSTTATAQKTAAAKKPATSARAVRKASFWERLARWLHKLRMP